MPLQENTDAPFAATTIERTGRSQIMGTGFKLENLDI